MPIAATRAASAREKEDSDSGSEPQQRDRKDKKTIRKQNGKPYRPAQSFLPPLPPLTPYPYSTNQNTIFSSVYNHLYFFIAATGAALTDSARKDYDPGSESEQRDRKKDSTASKKKTGACNHLP